MKDFKFVFFIFLIWRVLLFVPLIISLVLIPYRRGYEYTNILGKFEANLLLGNSLIFPWGNFDGVHYLSIAGYGYLADGRFFPLYPILIYGLSNLFGDSSAYSESQFFSALLISNVSFLLAIFYLYKLIKEDYSKKVAKLAAFFLLIFPTSFFFGSIYSESLFLFLLVTSFYFANKKRWLIASLFALLLTLTRINGIFIFPALLYQLFKEENLWGEKLDLKKLIRKIWPLIFIPFGLLSFGAYSYLKFGDFFNFIKAHGGQANGRSIEVLIFPLQTLYRYFKIITEMKFENIEWWIAILEVCVFLFTTTFLYAAYKQKVKTSYIIFAGLSFLLPILSGTFSGLPRYVLVLFPVFITLALLKATYLKTLYILISIPLLFILLMLFSKGYYIS